MKKLIEEFDVVVCGGGLAGFCAAVAAARHGAKTCLVQDRPVLGGNSSSEVRVTPHGAAAFHAYARETGIISEVLIEERARNHETIFENGWTNSVWDLVLYDLAKSTDHLTLHVNTAITAVVMEGDDNPGSESKLPDASFGFLHRLACNRSRWIRAVIGRVANAELEIEIRGKYVIDCSGDGIVADLAGCEWRMGSESRDEFGEPHAPVKGSRDTMGSSIHFRARDMGRPVPFEAPAWAVKHENAAYFYQQGRLPKDLRGGYWWIEIGVPWDTIYQAEDIRHELTRHALGIWDWIKNKDPKTKQFAANFALDWLGQVPGKRESRRIMGRRLLTENEIQNKVAFPDEIAFGGWFLDLHTPGGLLAPTSEPATAEGYNPTSSYARKSYVGPWGVPLSILIAKDIDNLLMAGRNVSVTHAALGTARVMATTALMGQAVGTACAHALKVGLIPGEFTTKEVEIVQQQLLRDGCFLPNRVNSDPNDLARRAVATASSEDQVIGARPDDRGQHEGLTLWTDQATPLGHYELTARRGQWIGIGTEHVDSVDICLTNLSDEVQTVKAWIVAVDDIWDYRTEPGAPLAATTLTVPRGQNQWIRWSLGVPVRPGRYIRLDVDANPSLAWPISNRIIPGHVAAFDMGGGKMRRYGPGVTLAYRISPAQPCFGPANVLTGVTRPYRGTNLWRSDPTRGLPQWLQLEWPEEVAIKTVEITFPGHLVREYHAYGPLYRDPQCPRDYQIEIWHKQSWRSVCQVTGNYQRRRCHTLPVPASASKLRITVTATNGDHAAAVYEVRCYA